MTDYLKLFGLDIESLAKVGIYSIHHRKAPDRLYIGSTTRYTSDRSAVHHGFYKRFYDHLYRLRNNCHYSKFLQNTVNKYGIEGLVFRILQICEDCSKKEIWQLEQSWIDRLKPVYNGRSTVFPEGRIWTEEDKTKRSKDMKGRSLPEAVYTKIKKQVYQYSKDRQLIQEFNSIEEAFQETKIDRASISKCAAGHRKTAGKYIWTFNKFK